jgi:hypothetical protein
LRSRYPIGPVTAARQNGNAASNALSRSRSRISTDLPDEPLCSRVDRVAAVSEPGQALLVKGGVDRDRAVVIPHGVDLFLNERHYDVDLRWQYGLGRDLPLLVCHGIFSCHANLDGVRLIAAELLPRLTQRGYCAKMLATGRDPPQEPVHEDVIFTGPVPDLAPYLKNADSAVIPL